MSDGRTTWWAMDSGWFRRELVVELGEEVGALANLVLVWLCCEAKAQNDAGRVKAGWRTVARGTCMDRETVRESVVGAAEIGLLDELDYDNRRFTARISGWRADQEHMRSAARAAAKRKRDGQEADGGAGGDGRYEREAPGRGLGGPENTPDEGSGPSVTDRDGSGAKRYSPLPTRQDKTKQQQLLEDSLRSSSVEPFRLDAAKERLRVVAEVFAYWQQRCGHPQAKLTPDRRRRIEARLREGYTAEQIRKGIDGAALGAFVNDRGQRFDDIELICRSAAKLDSFIARADAPQPAVDATTRRRLEAAVKRGAA